MKRIIYIDTREKLPYSFKGYKTVKKALKVGDYSVQGGLGNGGIILERKTPEDLINTLTKKENLVRFKKELRGMQKFSFKGIIIECNLNSFLMCVKNSRSTANPYRLLDLLFSLCIIYSVSPIFCGSRKGGEIAVLSILQTF